MNQFRVTSFNFLPPIIKNLMIINVIVYFMVYTKITNEVFGFDLIEVGALYFWRNDNFQIWQLITHLFLHKNFSHLFGNMFTLWMFGSLLENTWGKKRFLNFYILTGLGSAIIYLLFKEIQYQYFGSQFSMEAIEHLYSIQPGYVPTDPNYFKMFAIYMTSAIGASGVTYGIKMGVALIFPNLMIIFPIPMKMKYLMFAWIILEASSEIFGTTQGISHIGHLSGILFAYLIIKYWRKQGQYLY